MTRKRFEVCPASELEPGERRIVPIGGFSIGVFNVDGEFYAMKNDCPHQRAPLCKGKVTGTTTSDTPGEYNWERDGQIVTCPWHGWEFDVTSGESVFNPHKVKAKTFEARIEEPNDETDQASAASDGGATARCETTGDGGCGDYKVQLEGEEPPVETYEVQVERETVVVYL